MVSHINLGFLLNFLQITVLLYDIDNINGIEPMETSPNNDLEIQNLTGYSSTMISENLNQSMS